MPARNRSEGQQGQERGHARKFDERPEVLAHGMERPEDEGPDAEGHVFVFNNPEDEQGQERLLAQKDDEGSEAEGHIMAWGKQEDRDPSDIHLFNKPEDDEAH